MPSLLELSNEILYEIIERIHPDDIISFSLSRLHLHRLAEKAVALHLQRKRIYENVLLHGCHRHEDNAHPLKLMQEMYMDWRVGEYIKCLTFECCHHPNGVDDAHEEEDANDIKTFEVEKRVDDTICQTTMQAIQGYIKEKVVQLGFIPQTTYPYGFNVRKACQDAETGTREAMLALLFFFVPNLEDICLARSTRSTWHVQEAIRSISSQKLQQNPRAQKVLKNLSQVRFLGYDNDEDLYSDERGEDVEVFMSFAALPSMRTMLGDFVAGTDEPADVWPFAPHTSNVTEIILRNSAVEAGYLKELLAGIKSLKRFTYDHNNSLTDAGAMETLGIIEALHDHAKHSLEYLALTGTWDPHGGRSEIQPCSGLLREFETLKEFVLHSSVYIQYAVMIGNLVDLLPPSVETVQLLGADVPQNLIGRLKDFFEQKQQRLPRLKKLVLGRSHRHGPAVWERRLRERLEEIGVELVT